ncbi:hypothetical protein AVEN_6756-1 [Araneus ventricosus]|uniref:Uncharacterized protein n=1 Tax=Araneus ventricosus TaxID=182803 RepID=A0A4Y2ICH6_ARAVE|nr:hypothetical protein AVEN_6756-1 [Araneus ventricosus]
MSLPDLPFKYRSAKAVVVDEKIIFCESQRYINRLKEVSPPVYWDERAQLWRIIDESSPWYKNDNYSFLALDDCRIVKDLTARNRRPGTEWQRSLLV